MSSALLSQAKQEIRNFIRTYWSDQKLAEVYAFNADGKMRYHSTCCCFLGVTQSEVLHQTCPLGMEPIHYLFVKENYAGAKRAEGAYAMLGWPSSWLISGDRDDVLGFGYETIRRRRLSPILRAEMRLRSRLFKEVPELQEQSA